MSEHLTENIKLRLDRETLEALRRLADLGDRNVSQEMRRALRAHVTSSSHLTSVEHVALLARQGGTA